MHGIFRLFCPFQNKITYDGVTGAYHIGQRWMSENVDNYVNMCIKVLFLGRTNKGSVTFRNSNTSAVSSDIVMSSTWCVPPANSAFMNETRACVTPAVDLTAEGASTRKVRERTRNFLAAVHPPSRSSQFGHRVVCFSHFSLPVDVVVVEAAAAAGWWL